MTSWPACRRRSRGCKTGRHRRPSHPNGHANGNGRTDPPAGRAISGPQAGDGEPGPGDPLDRERQHADLDGLLRDFGVVRPEDLSLRQASELIDTLKAASQI